MKKSILISAILVLIHLISCTPDPTKSNFRDFESYSINGIQGIIDTAAGTVTVRMPSGTDLKSLSANFKISALAVTNHPFNVPIDFTKPILYWIKSENLLFKDWTITVTSEATKSSEKEILTYTINSTQGVINSATGAINVVMPAGTDLVLLSADFTLSPLAKCNVGTGTFGDYTNPRSYTVTAEDGSTKQFIATVTAASNPFYTAINETVKYATADNGSDLQINIQTPAGIPTNTNRPVIMMTHGTGGSEQNALSIHALSSYFLSQGIIVANFNFYGNNSTKNKNDGKHLYDQYPQVIEYLKTNAAKYHINTNAMIAAGASGSGGMAIHTALKKNIFGCIIECAGMVSGYTWDMPASLPASFSFGGIQTRSDNAFGPYRYLAADAITGASHNGNAYTENTSIMQEPTAWPNGNCKYSSAWGDFGFECTSNYLSSKYGANFKTSLAGNNYTQIIEGSTAHCSGAGWDAFIKEVPKKMLNDRGITW